MYNFKQGIAIGAAIGLLVTGILATFLWVADIKIKSGEREILVTRCPQTEPSP